MSDTPSTARLVAELSDARRRLADAESDRDKYLAQATDAEAALEAARAEAAAAKAELQQAQAGPTRADLDAVTARADAAEAQAARWQERAEAYATKLALQPNDAPARDNARLDELERLLAAPDADSGVTLVVYYDTDGKELKRRYRTSDGEKFRVLPDAELHESELAIADALGLPAEAAKAIVARRDLVKRHLEAL